MGAWRFLGSPTLPAMGHDSAQDFIYLVSFFSSCGHFAVIYKVISMASTKPSMSSSSGLVSCCGALGIRALEIIAAIVRFYPGIWVIENGNLMSLIQKCCILGGDSCMVFEPPSDLRSVFTWNFMPMRKFLNHSQAHVMARAASSICL